MMSKIAQAAVSLQGLERRSVTTADRAGIKTVTTLEVKQLP